MPLIGLGFQELLVIGGIVVLLFGGKKLPQLGGAIGESIKNFRKGVKDPEGGKELEGAPSSTSPGEKGEKKSDELNR